jgi:anti-anti-sigma factor
MKVDVEIRGSVTVVIPNGALVDTEIDDVRRALTSGQQEAAPRVVMDMTEVAYVDGAAIEFLLEFAASAPSRNMQPRIAGLTETVREALDLTDTLSRFYRFDSVESAVRSYM